MYFQKFPGRDTHTFLRKGTTSPAPNPKTHFGGVSGPRAVRHRLCPLKRSGETTPQVGRQ